MSILALIKRGVHGSIKCTVEVKEPIVAAKAVRRAAAADVHESIKR